VDDQVRDDLDELFGHLKPIEPAPGFTTQVLARTVPTRPARPLRLEVAWTLLDFLALAALAAISISLGQALGQSGGLDVLQMALENVEVLADARAEFISALVETLPWLHLVGLALDLTAIFVLSRMVLADWPGSRRREVGGR
jgi:hypothetical protein